MCLDCQLCQFVSGGPCLGAEGIDQGVHQGRCPRRISTFGLCEQALSLLIFTYMGTTHSTGSVFQITSIFNFVPTQLGYTPLSDQGRTETLFFLDG